MIDGIEYVDFWGRLQLSNRGEPRRRRRASEEASSAKSELDDSEVNELVVTVCTFLCCKK